MENCLIKVSVIIPVYNVENYVRESVLSIINQTLKEIEIIIVNDGSTDSSLNIIEDLAKLDNRIQVISITNQGQSIARNLGIYKAQGEFIYFFDSDDLLEKETLEECYNKCKHQQLDFLFFDANVFSDDNISMEFTSYNRTDKFDDKTYIGVELLKEQLANNSFSASVCLTFIRKKYLDNLNLYFYPRIIHEDELFAFILYLKANRIGLINKIYFHRRLRPNSTMTTTYGENNINGYLTVCRELKKYRNQYYITLEENKLIKKRIIMLLSDLIYKINIFPSQNSQDIISSIKKEFYKIINPSLFVKLYFPYIYHLLQKYKINYIRYIRNESY